MFYVSCCDSIFKQKKLIILSFSCYLMMYHNIVHKSNRKELPQINTTEAHANLYPYVNTAIVQ